MRRITWLVGPPGAGKSTWARLQDRWTRVVELTDMLAPLIEAPGIRKGVLHANDDLVALIRSLERHEGNADKAPLLVVAGLVTERLFPLGGDEDVLLLLPERARWRRQLESRPAKVGRRESYKDVAYSELWYDRFAVWVSDGRPMTRLETTFKAELIGHAAENAQ